MKVINTESCLAFCEDAIDNLKKNRLDQPLMGRDQTINRIEAETVGDLVKVYEHIIKILEEVKK